MDCNVGVLLLLGIDLLQVECCHLPTLYIGMEYIRTHSFKLAEEVPYYLVNISPFCYVQNIRLACPISSFLCRQRSYALQIHLCIMNLGLLLMIWKSKELLFAWFHLVGEAVYPHYEPALEQISCLYKNQLTSIFY